MGNEKLIFPDFTPDYVLDEISKYFWKKERKRNTSITFDNILALIKLAIINNRINNEQAREIEKLLYEIEYNKKFLNIKHIDT